MYLITVFKCASIIFVIFPHHSLADDRTILSEIRQKIEFIGRNYANTPILGEVEIIHFSTHIRDAVDQLMNNDLSRNK